MVNRCRTNLAQSISTDSGSTDFGRHWFNRLRLTRVPLGDAPPFLWGYNRCIVAGGQVTLHGSLRGQVLLPRRVSIRYTMSTRRYSTLLWVRYLDRGAVLCTATREAYTGIMTGNVVDISHGRATRVPCRGSYTRLRVVRAMRVQGSLVSPAGRAIRVPCTR